MRDDLRWAARYDFVEELWRGRARVIFDPELETALLERGSTSAHDGSEGLRALVDALLPQRPAEPVWMVVGTPEIAVELGRGRVGTTFVPLDGMLDVLRRAQWDVALVDLERLRATDLPSGGRSGAAGRVERAATVLAALGRGVDEGRAVILGATARDDDLETAGLDYAELTDVLARDLGGGRVFGVYSPPMAAIVDFGEPIEASEDEASEDEASYEDETSEDSDSADDTGTLEIPVSPADDDDIPLVYDNTLGSQEPPISYYLAIAGAELSAEGLTLVELPPLASRRRDDASGAALRAQLAQARRRADIAAIDRQTQLERIDALEGDNDRLQREATELRDRLARAVEPGGVFDAAEPAERLDAALAREQALRWRVTQLERELDALVGRPVEPVEAELARLRAQLDAAQASATRREAGGRARSASSSAPGSPPGAGVVPRPAKTPRPSGEWRVGNNARSGNGGPLDVSPSATQVVVRAVDDLVRRVERGGIGTLELRRHLVALRRRLQR